MSPQPQPGCCSQTLPESTSKVLVCFHKNVGTWVQCSHIWGYITRVSLISCQLWDSDSSCVQRTI